MKENNSKIIKLMRTIPFSQEANIDLTEFFGGAARGIGSYFKGKKPGSGLTFKEEKLLMPELVNLPSDDRDFRKAVELFFTDITTRVPEKGLPLEIALMDNTKPLGAEIETEEGVVPNMPINIEEYVTYRHAISHPQVAPSQEEARGNQLILFYVLDEKKTAEALQKDNDIKDQAMTEYLLIKKDEAKVDMVLTNLGKDTREIESGKQILMLKEYIEQEDVEYSNNFLQVVKDNKLDVKYRIRKLIQSNILRRVGTRVVIVESGDIIGTDIDEAVTWFEDKSNSDIVGTLKARYQEFAKKAKV